MHLDVIRAVGAAATMVYRRRIDHGWSIEWAGDSSCIIWWNISSKIVYSYFLPYRLQIDAEQCISKPFPRLEPRDH